MQTPAILSPPVAFHSPRHMGSYISIVRFWVVAQAPAEVDATGLTIWTARMVMTAISGKWSETPLARTITLALHWQG